MAVRPTLALLIGLIAFLALVIIRGSDRLPAARAEEKAEADRSPVDLVLTRDGRWLLTCNQTSGTVSLIETATGKIAAEVPCGEKAAALCLTPKEDRVLVGATWSGELAVLSLKDGKLATESRIRLGYFEPRGVAASPDGKLAYVALTTAHQVAVVDLEKKEVVGRIDAGRWPRYLALTKDGSRLAVGANGDGGVSVIDPVARKLLFQETFSGLNLGQMQISADGKSAYFPWMVYRNNPITANNIRLGWVLASRIARVKLDAQTRREAISLDPQGKAIADPHGIALSPAEQWMVCAASGTHELLVYKLAGLPFQDYGGPGDHIDAALLKDSTRFYRIPLGGRPMAVRFGPDGKEVFVVNYLSNAVQVVSLEKREVVRTLALGGSPEPQTLVRKGEAFFFDGQRSLDQWYSCHSCHYEGHVNAVAMDTRNDGRFGNFKTVLSLRNVVHTGPWFWHGWEKDLDHGLAQSASETMLGKTPSADDVAALKAYLGTLTYPRNPYRKEDGSLSEPAKRGEIVFQSEKAGCARCHSGLYFTDGKIHEVGTGDKGDVYRGYNPPSLLGIHDRTLFLHDGRTKTLEETLKGPHSPAKVTNKGALTEQELADLIEYLKSL
jgi:DNA-binding beta-propeller fold protein YncE